MFPVFSLDQFAKQILFDVDFIDCNFLVIPVTVFLQQISDVLLRAVKDFADMVHLDVEQSDVDLVEGDCPQNLQLGSLDVEREVVDRGVA